MTIFKYLLEGRQGEITAPAGARFLHAEVVDGKVYVWALVAPHQPEKRYEFRMYWTGEDLIAMGAWGWGMDTYVGTARDPQSGIVRHVFVDSEE